MAKAVSARRQGDEFQAMFFWNQLVNVLVDKNVNVVTFESDQRIFVDDIVVEYSQNILDQFTGQEYCIDAFQCKYHVSRGTTFSVDKLLDPKFINNEQSMLQRLYDAYLQYLEKGVPFRLHIVSSSGWDAHDQFCRFLSSEGHVRPTFFEKGPRSAQGSLRTKFSHALGISVNELKPFLDVVRFDLGLNRRQILESLNANLSRAGLLSFDRRITNNLYADLAWKWYEQGINSFDRSRLEELALRERLVDAGRKELLAIRHQSLNPIMPNAILEELSANLREKRFDEISLDSTSLYQNGRLTSPLVALKEQSEKTQDIINLYRNNPNLELAYYGIAHIPLVFLLGFQLNSRKSIHLFEHNRKDDSWGLPDDLKKFPKLDIKKEHLSAGTSTPDVVIKFGISYKVLDVDVDSVVSSPMLKIDLSLASPTRDIVRNIEQLEEYAKTFRNVLDEIHNLYTHVNCVHVFYAGPVSLALRCGQQISPTIHPKVLVYNYTNHDSPKYKWGVCVNTPVDSPGFLVQL